MIVLRIPADAPETVLRELRLIALRYPGDQRLKVRCDDRTIELGPRWTYDGEPACLAALSEFGVLEEPEC